MGHNIDTCITQISANSLDFHSPLSFSFIVPSILLINYSKKQVDIF